MILTRKHFFSLGATTVEMISSLIFIQLVAHVIQTTCLMIILFWIYDNPLRGGVVAISILMLITGISGMFHGKCGCSIRKIVSSIISQILSGSYTGDGTKIG